MGNCVASRAKQSQKASAPQNDHKIPEIEKREVKREFNDYEARKFKKILHLNFDRKDFYPLLIFQLRYRNQQGGFVTPDQMASIVLEFKRFLFLAAISPTRVETNKTNKVIREDLTPSPVVDRFWRLIMANTKLYEEICKPLFSAGSFSRDSRNLFNLPNYKKTVAMYKAYFGSGVSSIWPPYKEADQLERAHHGFMRLNLEHFLDFDREFRLKVHDLKDKDEIQKIYLVDIANLRTVSKLRLNEYDDDTSSNASILRSYYFKNSKHSLMDSIGPASKIDSGSAIKSPKEANKRSLFYENNSIEQERDDEDLVGERYRIESGGGGSTLGVETLPPGTTTENKGSVASVEGVEYRSVGSIENYKNSLVQNDQRNKGSLIESTTHERKAQLNQLTKNQPLDDTIESDAVDLSEEDSKELIPTATDNKEQSMAISVEVGGGMLMEDSRLQELNQNLNSQWEFLKAKYEGKLEAAKIP